MNDLRCHRFYKTDLIHPTEQAADYVFEQFKSCYWDDLTAQIAQRHQKINQINQHRTLLTDNDKGLSQINLLESEILKLKNQL